MTYEIIKKIIDTWDPIKLLTFAPKDEYDEESMKIFKCNTDDAKELSEIIFNVFKTAFEESFTKSNLECIEVANLIIRYS